MSIPDYIVDRIRKAPPTSHFIVPHSTPVVAFGDATKARIATLGLNPSSAEFEKASNVLLPERERRLATLPWLGVKSLQHASPAIIEKVLEESNNYFSCSSNPFRKWFDKLLPPLKALQASYYDGTACHLDIVQWATSPKWGDLQTDHRSIAQNLVREDIPFLRSQLTKCSNIEVLLLNGSGVMNLFNKHFRPELKKVVEFGGYSSRPCTEYRGKLYDRIKAISWSVNYQAQFAGVRRGYDEELSCHIAAL